MAIFCDARITAGSAWIAPEEELKLQLNSI